jgi:hypothetical protein
MAKKILLENRPGPTLFTLLGISCHLRDYQLTFQMNGILELGFVKEEDFQDFSFFFCRDDNGFNAYYLLGNRGPESILVPEMKQTDYLLLVEGPFNKGQKDRMLKNIKGIGQVLTAYEVNLGQVKNFDVLLNELELHFMNIHKEKKTKYSPVKK